MPDGAILFEPIADKVETLRQPADAAVICPWTMYLCYADKALLARHFESLERFIGFMVDQRLLERPVPVDTLFHPSVLAT